MPRKPLKLKKIRQTGLTGRQIEHLWFGWCLGNSFPFDSLEARRQAWVKNKDHLLSMRGKGKIQGVFGHGFKQNEIPEAMKVYERKIAGDYTRQIGFPGSINTEDCK